MFVSESEAFWLALVYDRVLGCSSMQHSLGESAELVTDAFALDGAGELAPSAPPIDATFARSEDRIDGADVYEVIRDLAAAFGIARPLEIEPLSTSEELNVRSPEDTRWGIFSKQVLSNEEFQHLQDQISSRLSDAQDRLTTDEGDDLNWRALRGRLARYAPSFVVGYTQSAPTVLLTVGSDGTPRIFAQVAKRDEGLYRSLLEWLIDAIPLPPIERIALAGETRPDVILTTAWIPSLYSLEKPIGGFDRDEVQRAVEHFKSANESKMGWSLATRFLTLEGKLQFFIWDLDEYERWADSVDRNETPRAIGDAEELLPAEADQTHSPNADDADQDPSMDLSHVARVFDLPEALTQVYDRICEAAEREASRPPAIPEPQAGPGDEHEDGEPDVDPWELINSRDSMLEDLRGEAEDLADFCRESGFPGVAEMVLDARSRIPDSSNPLKAWTQSLQATVSDRIAEQLREAMKRLRDARRVTYGELRLKALQWDEHTLSPPALPGWSRQNANIRDSIKVAIDQLNNGLRPFIVMSQLAPAVEVLLQQLAAKHLKEFHGLNPGGLLRELRKVVGLDHNGHEDRVTLSIAHALVSMRNWVTHDSSSAWDRDHAAFFLNGLSLMLRQV